MAKEEEQPVFEVQAGGVLVLKDADIPESYEDRISLIQSMNLYVGRHVISAYYNIGMTVAKIQDDHAEESGSDNTYGSNAVPQVAEDSGISERLVYDMHRFYRAHDSLDKVVNSGLDWSVHRALLPVKDDAVRKKLETQAGKERWTVKQTKEEVSKANGTGSTSSTPAITPATPDDVDDEPSPRAYFGLFQARLAEFFAELQDLTSQYREMLAISNDEERTSDEDWEAIKADMKTISSQGKRIGEYLIRKINIIENDIKDE